MNVILSEAGRFACESVGGAEGALRRSHQHNRSPEFSPHPLFRIAIEISAVRRIEAVGVFRLALALAQYDRSGIWCATEQTRTG
jgi:hypothetical protein